VRRPICLAEGCDSSQGLAEGGLVWGAEELYGPGMKHRESTTLRLCYSVGFFKTCLSLIAGLLAADLSPYRVRKIFAQEARMSENGRMPEQ
jgi:hypothetical protein